MSYEFSIFGERHEAATFAECSAIFSRIRDESLEGASEFPAVVRIREVGYAMPVARFSYNGRIWRDKPWAEGDVPLYDNRAA